MRNVLTCCVLTWYVLAVGVLPASAQDAPISVVGPAAAPAVITVYSDFACEPCGHVAVVLQEVMAARPDQVRIIFKHAPLDAASREAHLAALASARLGRFWDMHSILFANQNRLTRRDALEMAVQLEFDVEGFQQALADPALEALLDADIAEARSRGYETRPAILLNGTPVSSRVTREELLHLVDRAR